MEPLHLFYWLIVAHFVADFPLQSNFIAENKDPTRSPLWFWVLSAHAIIHGGFVAFILGNPLFGLAETVAHALTDYAKCKGVFGRGAFAEHFDQFVHLATKALWVGLAMVLTSKGYLEANVVGRAL